MAGKAIKVAGIAAGLVAMTACSDGKVQRISSDAYLASSLSDISPSNCPSPDLGSSFFTILSSLLVASEDILCTFPRNQKKAIPL